MGKPDYLKTKIFLDSGNPAETQTVLNMLGFLDGQTTNPSLVAKNPDIQNLKNEGKLGTETIWQEYKKVAEKVHQIIPEGSVSVEVYADTHTDYESMLKKGRELASWFPGIFVKLPVTKTGLEVAHTLVAEGVNVNITLSFSQEQAAAVHMATIGAKRGQVYVSPFIGRLDDKGIKGLDLISNISRMYKEWNSHVFVLSASIRSLNHLFGSFEAGADIVTVPIAILEKWEDYGLEKDPQTYEMNDISQLTPIPFESIEQKPFTEYNLHHELTETGIAKFSADWTSLLHA